MRNVFLQGLIDTITGKSFKRIEEISKMLECIISRGGQTSIPDEFKCTTIKEYAEEYNCKTFIETGTFKGGKIELGRDIFDSLHTIELYEPFYKNAVEKFKDAENVKCYFGNSKDVLPEILSQINSRPLFWLDAHYSGEGTARAEDKETPIIEELEIILNSVKDCVILIDDAREFGIAKDYPTIFKLKRFVLKKAPAAEIEVYQDIIRIIIP